MVRIKLIFSLLVITALFAVAVPGPASAASRPVLRGVMGLVGQSVEGWLGDEDLGMALTGTIGVTGGYAGLVGFGEIMCNDGDGDETISQVVGTYGYSPATGQGVMALASTGDSFCDSGEYTLVLRISVSNGGSLVRYEFMGDAEIGDDVIGYGKMERINLNTLAGNTFAFSFFGQDDDDLGAAGTGYIIFGTDTSTGLPFIQEGHIYCNYDGSDYQADIQACAAGSCVTEKADGTGYINIGTSGVDEICDFSKQVQFDFVKVKQSPSQAMEVLFHTDGQYYIIDTTRTNAGNELIIAGEMHLMP